MRNLIVIMISLYGLTSCNNEGEGISDIKKILTTTTWTVPADDKNPKSLEEVFSFNSDGSYIKNLDRENSPYKIIMKGTWKWESETELSILTNEMIVNGESFDLGVDDNDRCIFRIIGISRESLSVISRNIGDAEDSGFARNRTYAAAGL